MRARARAAQTPADSGATTLTRASKRCAATRAQGASCSLGPPEIEPGFKIPGGLYSGETAYYFVKNPANGNRVRLLVESGVLDVKGKVGRVPTQQSFQLLGKREKDAREFFSSAGG